MTEDKAPAPSGGKATCDTIKVKCSCCGEEMDCPDAGLNIDMHACEFCTEVMEEGMEKDEIAILSRKERELSPYYNSVGRMTQFIFSKLYEKARTPRDEMRDMSKRDIEELAFGAGIHGALQIILHACGPDIFRQIIVSPLFALNCVTEDDMEDLLRKFREDGIDIDNSMVDKRAKEFMDSGDRSMTEEEIAKMMNYVFFGGDWEKHLEWEKKHHGHSEDIELLKRLMKEEKANRQIEGGQRD